MSGNASRLNNSQMKLEAKCKLQWGQISEILSCSRPVGNAGWLRNITMNTYSSSLFFAVYHVHNLLKFKLTINPGRKNQDLRIPNSSQNIFEQ